MWLSCWSLLDVRFFMTCSYLFPMLGKDKDRWLRNCGHELTFMQDTEPFEDDAWINDQYMDTQVMDTECDNEDFLLCGETQAVNLGFETQEEPLVEGKQLLEGSDGLVTQALDRFDDVVVADSDDDVTTVVLEDNSELSDSDDSHRRGGNLLSSEDNGEQANENIKSTGLIDARLNEHGITGEFLTKIVEFVYENMNIIVLFLHQVLVLLSG